MTSNLAAHRLQLFILSISGGIIFMLPFLQEVYYLPLANTMQLSNTEVGAFMSMFGAFAMLSYVPGGMLADRISPRLLCSCSLIATGVGGFYFATFPPYRIGLAIHGFWGLTIGLLFWSAMIRAVRLWSSREEQGRAFGLLEGGRGIGEVVSSTALLAVFALADSETMGLVLVINLFSALIVLLGALSWLVMKNEEMAVQSTTGGWNASDLLEAAKLPQVWLVAGVILAGYCAYWATFRFTPYATDVFGLSVTIGATIGVGKMWLKPIAASVAGFFADKFGVLRLVDMLFVMLVSSFGVIAFMPGEAAFLLPMIIGVTIISIFVFSLRGIYFALIDHSGVPKHLTGTAAGLISVIAYTPDIFMPLLGGVLVDSSPGVDGYRYFFLVSAAICAIGWIASKGLKGYGELQA
ncbi:MAG: MFS transporter [Woeseiaceae bacterium]